MSSAPPKKKAKVAAPADASTQSNPSLPLAGTIGVAGGDGLNHGMSAGGGARRTLPEIVVTYKLPLAGDVGAKGKAKENHEASQAEQSLILLQSLRQSRLVHLTAMLPPFSQRVRNGMVYPGTCAIPNLDPKQPHVLIQLGRADIRIGPHVFPRTKFWEARQERPAAAPSASSSAATSPVKQIAKPVAAPARPPPQPISAPPRPQPPRPAPPRPATTTSARPPAPAPQVDEALVIRVNQKAAVEPELRQLLHLAATGSASPQQLRALGGWIQVVTEELKREGTALHAPSLVQAGLATPRVGASSTARPPSSAARPPTPSQPASRPSTSGASTPKSAGPSTPRPAQLPPRPNAPRPPSVSTPTTSPQAPRAPLPTASSQVARPPAPPTPAASSKPSGPPPILIVEFRENPSMRFLLPLWRGAAVERKPATEAGGSDAEVALTFMLPALGSSEAGREAEKHNTTEEEQAADRTKQRHERFPATWRIRNVVSDSMWEAFGRCAVVRTAGEEAGKEDEEKDKEREKVAEMFVQVLKSMPRLGQLCYDAPAWAVPPGLADHLSDKFLPKPVRLASRPSVKRKGAVQDGLLDTEGDAHLGGGERGTGGAAGVEKKVKRQRHVATHNKDGTLKLCEACGTNSTPLWRRGPRGPSTLCNACGGRYKAGRLVLPAVPPTAPNETDKDQSSAAANAASSSAAPKEKHDEAAPPEAPGIDIQPTKTPAPMPPPAAA